MKLTIFDKGDESVGLFPTQWEVDCPFDEITAEENDLQFFKERAKDLYSDFAQGKLTAMYDFEIQKLEEMYNQSIEQS